MASVDTPPRERGALAGLIVRHPLASYFVIAYLPAWLARSQFVPSRDGSGWLPFHATYPYLVSVGLGTFGPAPAAVVVICVREGDAGLLAFLRRIVLWRVGFRWWAFAMLSFPITATRRLPAGGVQDLPHRQRTDLVRRPAAVHRPGRRLLVVRDRGDRRQPGPARTPGGDPATGGPGGPRPAAVSAGPVAPSRAPRAASTSPTSRRG